PADFEGKDLDAERPRGFDSSLLRPEGANTCVMEKTRAGETWHSRLQELQLLPGQLLRSRDEARDVAPRPRIALDESGAGRLPRGGHHDDWDRLRRLACGIERGRTRGRQNDVHLEPDQLRRDLRKALAGRLGNAKLDQQILAFDPAKLPQSLIE